MTSRNRAKSSVRAKKPPPDQSKGGPVARAEAMRLLATGFTITAVSKQLKVGRGPVVAWRESPDGKAEFTAFLKERDKQLREAADGALRILRDGADKAARVLVEQLGDRDPSVRSLAARTLLDRVGVPRTERIETAPAPIDTSGLSDEELEVLAKIGARRSA